MAERTVALYPVLTGEFRGGGWLEKMLTGASLLRGEEVGTSPDVWMPRKSLAVADSAVFSVQAFSLYEALFIWLFIFPMRGH